MKMHFCGIGGVGMAALAALLKSEGHEIDGCDLALSPRTAWLERLGIKVFCGHDAAHVKSAELVVSTPAMAADSPELAAARKTIMRGELLAKVSSSRKTVAVCGSHGKTTTATFTAKLLKELGDDPAWAIGGETGDFPVAGFGKGPLVVEADESDGTLAGYRSEILVVTNCEYDHPDHFKTKSDYIACFDAARRNAKRIVEAETLSLEDWNIPLSAPHNRRNARAAIEVARILGHSKEAIARALPAAVAALPDRRFERVSSGVYIDYAHHPTEMACAIAMARAECKGLLKVLFQPHRYSRTKALLKSFPAAFRDADEVVLCPTYAAFEKPVEGGDIADLYKELRENPHAYSLSLARSCREAWTHAMLTRKEEDVVLVLGAGDIVKVVGSEILPPRRTPLGMGSNTWRSDLATNEEFFAVDSPAGRPGASLGIPWMAGIPGTIGGWIKMNAGAHGHSISELVEAVKVDGVWTVPKFGYRTSDINGVIEDVRLKPVPPGPGAEEYLARRRKFPVGTKGSVFKNPDGDFAGRILEVAGAKNLSVGGARVWSEHANVIVCGPDAAPGDFLALARLMHNRAFFACGISLKPEVVGIDTDF